MAVRKKVSRASSKRRNLWTEKVRAILGSIPNNSLEEIRPRDVLKMLKEKHPEIEISHSRRVYVCTMLKTARKKVDGQKIVRSRGLWSAKESWEIAMCMLAMCGGNHQVAQKKLREAKSCLTKIKKIELRAASIRKVG